MGKKNRRRETSRGLYGSGTDESDTNAPGNHKMPELPACVAVGERGGSTENRQMDNRNGDGRPVKAEELAHRIRITKSPSGHGHKPWARLLKGWVQHNEQSTTYRGCLNHTWMILVGQMARRNGSHLLLVPLV